MKSTVLWIIAIVLIVVLVLGLPLLFRFTGLGWYGGMMGRGGMLGGHFGYFFPLGFLWMGLMMLAPVALLVLIIMGGVALVNSLTRTSSPATPPVTPAVMSGRTCGNCGKPAQTDWNTCPYCGNPLS
jgi:hypothetical protein